MHQENLNHSKELVKSLQKDFFVANGAFKSALKQWENFYPNIYVSRDGVCLN